MPPLRRVEVAFVIPVREDGKVMLGIKKTGMGVGKLTLFGGKIESNESPLQAAVRELGEEAFVRPRDPMYIGRVTLDIHSLGLRLVAFVFRCAGVIGEPRESYEMTIEWHSPDQIPYHTMWADNAYWLPMAIAGTQLEGEFTFSDPDTLVRAKCNPKTPRAPLSQGSVPPPTLSM